MAKGLSRWQMHNMPEPEFYPDARRPRSALRGLDRYRGMPVTVVYRPSSRDPRDDREVVLKGVVEGVTRDPPRLILRLRDQVVKLPLDRVAAITIG